MKQKELKAALFDLDGVVFDTEPQYTIFWGSVCRQYHPEHPGLEQEIKGSTLTQIYERWFSGSLEAAREDVTRRLNDYEQQMHYDFLDGFEQLIRDLHNHGVKTAVRLSLPVPTCLRWRACIAISQLLRVSLTLFSPRRISNVANRIRTAI